MSTSEQHSFSFFDKTMAWGVHLFTSCGLLTGFMAILAINEKDWVSTMWWLIASLIIDGLDGNLARYFRVKEVLPYMNGKTIDYVIDFATYAIIPAYCFYISEMVPGTWNLICTFIILLVSALYYGKEGMVSNDMYFIGFPVMWNMVVFYLIFIFQSGPLLSALIVIVFAILHFVPIKFAYPSQAYKYRNFILILTVLFFISLILNLLFYPETPLYIRGLAILTALGYGSLAVYNTWLEK